MASEIDHISTPQVPETPDAPKGKVAVVDIASNIVYTTIIGGVLDALAGLNISGIISARGVSIGTNILISGPYGWWTEKIYEWTRTTKEAGEIRKRIVDLLAFDTFQLSVYATVLSIGSLLSEGHVNWKKVENGVLYLLVASPAIGPSLNWFMDLCRKLSGVKTLAEGAYQEEKTGRNLK